MTSEISRMVLRSESSKASEIFLAVVPSILSRPETIRIFDPQDNKHDSQVNEIANVISLVTTQVMHRLPGNRSSAIETAARRSAMPSRHNQKNLSNYHGRALARDPIEESSDFLRSERTSNDISGDLMDNNNRRTKKIIDKVRITTNLSNA
jgi:hypothetical protein